MKCPKCNGDLEFAIDDGNKLLVTMNVVRYGFITGLTETDKKMILSVKSCKCGYVELCADNKL